MIPKMKVVCNPFAKDELAPTVRFEPLNGFSIRHGNIKGTWLPNVADAVNDYNVKAQRALKSLRLASYVSETFPLASLPGIDTAWRQWQIANPPKPAPVCNCPACTVNREASKAHDAGKAERERRKGPTSGLLGLVAMLAAIGALDGLEDATDAEEPFFLDAMPEMAELLGKAGLLHRTGPNSPPLWQSRARWGKGIAKSLKGQSGPGTFNASIN